MSVAVAHGKHHCTRSLLARNGQWGFCFVMQCNAMAARLCLSKKAAVVIAVVEAHIQAHLVL